MALMKISLLLGWCIFFALTVACIPAKEENESVVTEGPTITYAPIGNTTHARRTGPTAIMAFGMFSRTISSTSYTVAAGGKFAYNIKSGLGNTAYVDLLVSGDILFKLPGIYALFFEMPIYGTAQVGVDVDGSIVATTRVGTGMSGDALSGHTLITITGTNKVVRIINVSGHIVTAPVALSNSYRIRVTVFGVSLIQDSYRFGAYIEAVRASTSFSDAPGWINEEISGMQIQNGQIGVGSNGGVYWILYQFAPSSAAQMIHSAFALSKSGREAANAQLTGMGKVFISDLAYLPWSSSPSMFNQITTLGGTSSIYNNAILLSLFATDAGLPPYAHIVTELPPNGPYTLNPNSAIPLKLCNACSFSSITLTAATDTVNLAGPAVYKYAVVMNTAQGATTYFKIGSTIPADTRCMSAGLGVQHKCYGLINAPALSNSMQIITETLMTINHSDGGNNPTGVSVFIMRMGS